MSAYYSKGGFARVFLSTTLLGANWNSKGVVSSLCAEHHRITKLQVDGQELNTCIKNMNLCEILLDYVESARIQKNLNRKRDNPWRIDDQAMRRLHISSYKRGSGLRYFANTGVTCMKPTNTERISNSLYGTEYMVEKDEDIPPGSTTMATHTPQLLFSSRKRKIEEAKAIVSMASHMVPAVFNRKEDPMNYLESHLIADKITPDDMEDNLALLFEELSNKENLSERELMELMHLAAKKMIYDLIQKASDHYENHLREMSGKPNNDQTNNNNEQEESEVPESDLENSREISFLSRESTQLSEGRIQRIAEELVFSVTEQVSLSIENKVLVDMNSVGIFSDGQTVSS